MSYSSLRQDGFTAVELLITLLVASMFLFAGYQLYTQVMKDGAEANKSAIVSSEVTARVQKESRDRSGNCVAATPAPTTEAVTGVGNVQFTTTISCPNATELPTLKYIKVEATYGSNPARSVVHAVYAK